MKQIAYLVILSALFAITAIFISVCDSSNKGAQYGLYRDQKRNIQFQYPKNWTVEEVEEQNVLLIMAPEIEENWQANVFIELRENPDKKPIDEQLDSLILNLKSNKKEMVMKNREILKTRTGIQAGVIVFEHNPELKLFEKEYLLLFGDSRVVFATGSAVSSLWSKYQKQIDGILESIEELK